MNRHQAIGCDIRNRERLFGTLRESTTEKAMGWKSFRDHYAIKHVVQIVEGRLLIGSVYVPDLISVGPDGQVRWGKLGPGGNADLQRVFDAINADPTASAALLARPDTFSASIPVYTWDENYAITEHQCEELGWPNLTHDGTLMHRNTFFADRTHAVRYALENAQLRAKMLAERVVEMRAEIDQKMDKLVRVDAAVKHLQAEAGVADGVEVTHGG